jgi:UDP-N-acetylmuramate: L-alanyl-gamma-D-glutamyl-meso-diaminopimelate ligase
METPKHIHMIAISGVGMAALAGLLKAAGHHVVGSDKAIFPPMSTLLEQAGILCKNGFDPGHIDPKTDLVIIGNAVSRDNPEVLAATQRGIPYYSLPQALSLFFLTERMPLVVVGTHGKTTTTSQLAFLLASAGWDPSVMVGGIMKNFNTNSRLGKGAHFVIEGDEYNSAFFDQGAKFLHYRPHHAILTSVELDHCDIYPDFSSIQNAFRQFVRLIPKYGFLVAHHDPSVMEVAKEAACPWVTYGLHPECDWQATEIQFGEEGTRFDLVYKHQTIGVVKSPLIGQHNVKNTLANIALTYHLGVGLPAILEGVRCFAGVARRQEIVKVVRDIIIMDDFAHHPTAITETMQALRLRYPKRRLWAVFEPRSASSRRNIFQKEFALAFQNADCTVLADLFAPEKVPMEQRLRPEEVIADVNASGKRGFFIPTSDEIIAFLSKELTPGDLVCIMSSGGFGGIYTKLADALQNG